MDILAPAKINMGLKIVGTMANGYHGLDMVMVPISLYDHIHIEKADMDSIDVGNAELPENNTINKMVNLVKDTFHLDTHYHIEVQKNIPMESGMAGGSSDAAAVLEGILALENITCSLEEKINLGKQVGADVPFCIVKKWARVQGIGEQVRVLDTDYAFDAIIVKPKEGVNTQKAFQLWHATQPIEVDVDKIEEVIVNKDYEQMLQCVANDLEKAALYFVPAIQDIKDELLALGLDGSLMSGSGSTVVGFSKDRNVLEHAKEVLKNKYEFVEIVRVG